MKLLILSMMILSSCAGLKNLEYKDKATLSQPEAGMALVYFFREKNLTGPNFIIHDEDDSIGILSSNSYFYIILPPGHHSFYYSDAWKDSSDRLELILVKNKTYYVAMKPVKAGSLSPKNEYNMQNYKGILRLSEEQSSLALLKDLREVDVFANQSTFAPAY